MLINNKITHHDEQFITSLQYDSTELNTMWILHVIIDACRILLYLPCIILLLPCLESFYHLLTRFNPPMI